LNEGLGYKPVDLIRKENTTQRLISEVSQLEEKKSQLENDFRIDQRNLNDQLKKLQDDVGLLELQLKEKDQELKLNELKYKELRKQMPYGHLKPLR
jgi:uncharacterized protein HemX